jgi:flagellar motility protein MotE (MotC chaperone)
MKEKPSRMAGSFAAVIILVFFLFFFSGAGNTTPAEDESAKEFSSVEERRLAETTQQERENIRVEKGDLELKKKELKTLEEGVDKKLAQIDAKIEELKKQQKILAELLTKKSEEELKKTEELAKIFEKMSPEKAALAISGLDQKLAADLLAKMKIKAAAKILDQISKQKATDLSTTFSTIQRE